MHEYVCSKYKLLFFSFELDIQLQREVSISIPPSQFLYVVMDIPIPIDWVDN